jgi:hypothetical protein
MFGGQRGDADLDEAWLFNPLTGTWSRLQPAGVVPQPRDGHAMAYDSASGAVVLFGGFATATRLEMADTWIYGPSRVESAP